MKLTLFVTHSAIMMLVASFVGCLIGGDKGSLTSVDGNIKLDDLSKEEGEILCEDVFGALAETQNEFLCRVAALEYAVDTSYSGNINTPKCKDYLSGCLDGTGTVPDLSEQGLTIDCEEEEVAIEGCTATVGDLDDCFFTMILKVNEAIRVLSCDGIPEDESELEKMTTIKDTVYSSEACVDLREQCPGILSTE